MNKLRTIGFSVLAVIVCYVAILTWVKRDDLVFQFEHLQKEYAKLQQENADLKQFAQSIQLDSVKEMEVKKRLNYAKPGETLVLFISPSPVPDATSTSWWDSIIKFFRR